MHHTKRFGLLVGFAALMVGLVMLPAGADGADASVSTKIVTPIRIQKQSYDLNFGKIAAGTSAGTVTIDPSKWLGDRLTSGGVMMVNATSVSDAAFRVTGEAGALYVITLPSSTAVQTAGGASMVVDTFTSCPWSKSSWAGYPTPGLISNVGLLSPSDGHDDLFVGATLHVGANQSAGAYSGTFGVTVAYQ